MKISQKIQLIRNQSGMSKAAFARYLGLNGSQKIIDLESGKTKSLSQDMTNRLINCFPTLNLAWLLEDKGEMLHEKVESSSELQEVNKEEGYLVPLVPVSVMAGDLTEFNPDGVDSNRCERILSPVKGVDMAFPVYGDSMEPEYPGGSNVFVKKICFEDFIPYGNVFVLDTTNGPLIKKVQRSDRDGYIRCVSLNVAAGYEPFDVPLRTVRNMYRVIMCLSMKG